MTTDTKLITADELLAMGDIGRCELVNGEIIHMPPGGASHGDVAGELFGLIWTHVRSRSLGKVYAAETGFTIARNPDTMRAPDVAFVRSARLPSPEHKGFFDGPPDLAVEVVSFNDLASQVSAKVEEWLLAGVTSVWVADPRTRTIHVYGRAGQVTRYRRDEELRDEPVLPGFVLKLSAVFPLP